MTKKTRKKCNQCGKKLERGDNKKYCSKDCRNIAMTNKQISSSNFWKTEYLENEKIERELFNEELE